MLYNYIESFSFIYLDLFSLILYNISCKLYYPFDYRSGHEQIKNMNFTQVKNNLEFIRENIYN
ncbi:hypothetical protein UT300017_23260 [Clostridium sp. CTA-17]